MKQRHFIDEKDFKTCTHVSLCYCGVTMFCLLTCKRKEELSVSFFILYELFYVLVDFYFFHSHFLDLSKDKKVKEQRYVFARILAFLNHWSESFVLFPIPCL